MQIGLLIYELITGDHNNEEPTTPLLMIKTIAAYEQDFFQSLGLLYLCHSLHRKVATESGPEEDQEEYGLITFEQLATDNNDLLDEPESGGQGAK